VIGGEALLKAFGNLHVLVVGDLMVDEYHRGHVERISPEAPVPIFSMVSRESTLGGAGNVVRNLRGLGVSVTVVGVLGEDKTAERALDLLDAAGVDRSGVVCDSERRSTRKERFVSMEHDQQVFRADEETAQEVSGGIEGKIIRQVREKAMSAQVILCSDYLKGVLTTRVLRAAFEVGREQKVPVIVAPKDKEPQKYEGATILMPNLRELSRLVGTPMDDDAWLAGSAEYVAKRLGLEALLVTRGSEGMTLFEEKETMLRRVDIPTVARNVYDVTGAGDTALAAFAAGIAAGATREIAAHLANISAGVVVGKRGTATVTKDEILEYMEQHPSRYQCLQEVPQTIHSVAGR
jgi:D-beta-D-heptose 7-phosphate kinase/D-beta-D-heptose 1-phosphate adenosyltransferase